VDTTGAVGWANNHGVELGDKKHTLRALDDLARQKGLLPPGAACPTA
jgi:hypothetical protein